MPSVLIYDGDCTPCSAAAVALDRVGNVETVDWENETAQRFLRDQFGEVPFAVFLVDTDLNCVYAGRSAARELAARAGMPSLAGDILSSEYDTVAKVVGVVTRRDRETDNYHDVYDLDEKARETAHRLVRKA